MRDCRKFLVLILPLMITATSLKAQVKNDMKICEVDSINGMFIHTVVDTFPEYKGGFEAFYKVMLSKIKLRMGSSIGSKVVLSFVIDTDGNILNMCWSENIEIAKEAVESMNNWVPGKIGGVNVPVRIKIPMHIKLG